MVNLLNRTPNMYFLTLATAGRSEITGRLAELPVYWAMIKYPFKLLQIP
ncbi:MAG: hypothetical protein JWP78_3086 [Mucilaginibacter sp.]|nr:hypothetical protein [Mucilaginibacter sp.]